MTGALGAGALLIAGLAYGATWRALHRRARLERIPAPSRLFQERPEGSVQTVTFPACDGTRLEAWLFLPRAGPAPLVVMAPGLGGTKDGLLEPFAWRFVEHGVAALAFDYRCFGGSDGTPRHWVDPSRHREDYESALAFVRSALADHPGVDPGHIALWGSSFSGGTAIVAASRDPSIAALVAQCPYLETPPHLRPRGRAMVRFALSALLDLFPLLPPVYVPLFGRPGEWVFAASAENPSAADFEGPLGSPFWRALPRPPLGGWDNRMLARGLAALDDAELPMDCVPSLSCPVLLVAARTDDMIPLAYVERAYARAGSAEKEISVLDCGHFDLYLGETREVNASRQAAFLARHLGATRSTASAPREPARESTTESL